MAKPLPLSIWDRSAGKLVEDWMEDAHPHYESDPQRSLTQLVKSHPLYDKLYAIYENSRLSAREIEPFISRHHIDMSDFEPVKYRSFAEFFDRRFRPDARQFSSSPREMGAFAEARYFGWKRFDPDQTLPVKGHSLNAGQVLGGEDTARAFADGPVLLVRLCPLDYHLVHYPDSGRTLDHWRCGNRLWTVNWQALQNKPDILFANERNVNILATSCFGRLGFVEIGALSVGRIAQVHPLDIPFKRGQQKSAFRFGGSAIVVFGERDKWQPADDIMEYTQQNIETLVRLGDCIAVAS